MTTNVPKGAGRAAATARRSKHAQRTPLPPKPGQVEAAREPVSSTKSQAKADALIAEAAKLGWAPATRSEGERTTLTLTRGEEVISIEWDGGVFVDSCTYSCPGRTPIKLRNASAAKKQMSIPAAEAHEKAQSVAAHKVARAPQRTARTRAPRLPFDPALATDEEVCAAVQGRQITWTNEISGERETTHVPDAREMGRAGFSRKPVIMKEGTSGRYLDFVDASGFRSVRVSSLVAVR